MAAEGASRRSPDLLRVHLAVAGFGFAGLFGKFLTLSPVIIVAGRAGFAALSLALLLALKPAWRGEFRGRGATICLGVLLAAHWWTFFQAIQTATVAVALVSFSAFPVLVILSEAIWQRVRPRALDLGAALAALGGVAVIVPRLDISDATFRGVLWGLASGVSFAVMVIWNRHQVRNGSPWLLAMIQNAVAFLVLLPLALLQSARPTAREWVGLAVLGVIFTAGTHGLFIQGLRTVPAKLASLICTLEPAYGILASALFLKEIPTLKTLLGALLITAAVISVSREARKPVNG
jgi:drug/metabolite transporter (DMT)-like permease